MSLETTKKNLVLLNINDVLLNDVVFKLSDIGSYAKDYSNVIFLYEPDFKLNKNSQVYSFLEDHCGFKLEEMNNVHIVDAENGFQLDLKDFDLDEEIIEEMISFLDQTGINDISKLEIYDYESLQISKCMDYETFKSQVFYIPNFFSDFNVDGFCLIGGTEDSIWEFSNLFDYAKLDYEIDYKFTF